MQHAGCTIFYLVDEIHDTKSTFGYQYSLYIDFDVNA